MNKIRIITYLLFALFIVTLVVGCSESVEIEEVEEEPVNVEMEYIQEQDSNIDEEISENQIDSEVASIIVKSENNLSDSEKQEIIDELASEVDELLKEINEVD